jgi:hypothetical protein
MLLTVVIFIRSTMVRPTLVIGINIGHRVYFGTMISHGYYVLEVSVASLPSH